MYNLKERISFRRTALVSDGSGGTAEGSVVTTELLADVKAVSSAHQNEGLQEQIGITHKIVIRQRDGFAPKIGDVITWRGQECRIEDIRPEIKHRKWWIIKASGNYGQN